MSYTIKSGDTLSSIAKSKGLKVQDLLKANPEIKDANKIKVGQRISLGEKTGGNTTLVDVTVIDDSDHVGWAASATRINEVYMTSVKTMVKNVINAAGKSSIRRLNILDHGNKNGIQIGDDRITTKTLGEYAVSLKILAKYFDPGGFVHLQHCDIGSNKPLLVDIAKMLGVPVYAGTGKHNPVYRFNLGDYVKCYPDGRCEDGAPRPD